MHDLLRDNPSDRLPLEEYWSDFNEQFGKTKAPGFWKLERQQTFKEPGNESWEAFRNGDWAESLRLIDAQRDDFQDYYRRIAEQGFATRRVRIIEKPITPYLQWELHVLRLRHEYGGLTRVIGPDRVREFETNGPLPEIYTLGFDVMYEAVYGPDGTLQAANRFLDPQLIRRCQEFIEGLYHDGEPLDKFFVREIADLEPPRGR